MLKNSLLVALIILFPAAAWSQNKKDFTISGTLKDDVNGETLSGATISFAGHPGIGVATNGYGYYSISVPGGNYSLIASYTGYRTDTLTIAVLKNLIVNPKLHSTERNIKEVVVSAHAGKNTNILSSPAGMQRMSIQSIRDVPVLLGEKDVLKTMQLLPGIQSAGDGKSGFYVRGGGADQNLILLDEATVYNASHVLGFFSIFNSDAIKDISIYKGGMPANYGGRLSSVEDVQMKDGNDQHLRVSGGIGLIASRLALEGPVIKGKGSFIISARRSYIDAFTPLAKDTLISKSKIYFYDVNLKANYSVNSNNRIFLSGYFGQDVNHLTSGQGLDYGNSTATFRWNHIFSSKLFSNTSLIYSTYVYNVHFNSNLNNVKVTSGIIDYHLKQNFNYYLSAGSKLDFGLEVTYHNTDPGSAISTQASSFNTVILQKKYSLESAAYISNDFKLTDRFDLVYGVRLGGLSVLGPGTFSRYGSNGNTISSTTYGKNRVARTYLNLEPRLAASYRLNDISSVKLSYDRTVQNIHLLNNSTSFQPTTVYLPSTLNIKPEIADQLAAGYYLDFSNHQFEFSTELYYKSLQHQLDYKNGANLVGNMNVEADLLAGSGRAYGWESLFKKKSGVLTGWVSYSLSKSERKIAGINQGNYYPAAQDQRHHLSVVALYQASPRWTFSADFVYSTGNAVTWPSGKFSISGTPIYAYSARNGNRLPVYNRLDIGATLRAKKTAHYESSWNFSIYNLYGRANAYTIAFQADPHNKQQTQVLQTALFKMVPSVTYNFKF